MWRDMEWVKPDFDVTSGLRSITKSDLLYWYQHYILGVWIQKREINPTTDRNDLN